MAKDGSFEYNDYEVDEQEGEKAGDAQAEWDEFGTEQSGASWGFTRGNQSPGGITARYLMADLPLSITEDDLRGYFGRFGEIKDVTIRRLTTGQTMGSVKFAYPTSEIRQKMLNDQHWIRRCLISVQTWKMQKLARPSYAKGDGKYTAKGDFGKDGKEGKGFGKFDSYGGDYDNAGWGDSWSDGYGGDFLGYKGEFPGYKGGFLGCKGDYGGCKGDFPACNGYGCGYALPFFGKGYKGDMAWCGGKANKEGPYGYDWGSNPFFGIGMGYKGCKDTYGRAGYGKQSTGSDWCWPDFESYDGASTWNSSEGGKCEPYHSSGTLETSPAPKPYLKPKDVKAQEEEDLWEERSITARYLLADLAEHITEEDIRTYFSVFGEIEDITLRRLETGKVIGSVKFLNPTLEIRNLMLKEVHEVQGCPVRVQTWQMRKVHKTGFKAKREAERWSYHNSKTWDSWAS